MSRRLVPGDAASLSAGGSTLGRLGVRLAADAEALGTAYGRVGTDWGGPTSLAIRRGGGALAADVAATAGQASAIGRALQDHATDLAALQADLRGLTERAERAGLELRDGSFAPAFGRIGEADAAKEQSRERARAEVAAELERLVTLAQRRRSELIRTLAQSQTELARISARLRTP